MAFDITFDYRFDTTGFFSADVRNALEAAASDWEAVIQDEFADVPAGVEFAFESPSQAPTTRRVTLAEPIDDLRIFVGAQDPPFGGAGEGSLAKGGVRGFDAAGDVLQRRIADDFRGQGPVSNFEPFAGAISVDPSVAWSFGADGPGQDENDFRSVMRHEIGHVLGVGQAQIFRDKGAGGSFDGPNARGVNNGDPLPLASDTAHTLSDFRDGDVLMSPSLQVGATQTITDVDKALLADIGYEIDGFTAQGSQPAIATDGNDRTIRGTVLADTIDARGGDDKLQGNAGDDTLAGGSGADTILGQTGGDAIRGGSGDDKVQGGLGADTLRGGPGRDALFGNGGQTTPTSGDVDTFYFGAGDGQITIQDFELETEQIVIDPDTGVRTVQDVLDNTIALNNGSRIDLGLSNGTPSVIDVIHEPMDTSPLTAEHIEINQLDAVTDDTSGGSGGDSPSGGGGGDTTPPSPPDGPPVDVLANAFLGGGQGLTVADPVAVFGRSAGSEAVVLDAGAGGLRADANIERFDFPDPLSAMHFAVTQRGLEITADGDRLVTIPSLNQATELRFADGDATLTQVGASSFELAGANGTTATLDSSGGGADVDLGGTTSQATADAPPQGQVAANLFLNANAAITVRDPVAVFGRSAGDERVALADDAGGVRLDANVERLDLAQPLDALTFAVTNAGLEIADGGTRPLVGFPSLNQPMTVRFADGDATLTQVGAGQFELAGGDGGTATIDGDADMPDVDLGDSTAQAVTAVGTGPDPDGDAVA